MNGASFSRTTGRRGRGRPPLGDDKRQLFRVRLSPERADEVRVAAQLAGVSESRWVEQAVALRLDQDNDAKADVQLSGVPAPMRCQVLISGEGDLAMAGTMRVALTDGSLVPLDRIVFFSTKSKKLAGILRHCDFQVRIA